jgi:hypothetical protein
MDQGYGARNRHVERSAQQRRQLVAVSNCVHECSTTDKTLWAV